VVNETPKIPTEAEKQVQRLETLRSQMEIKAQAAAKPPEPIRTVVERTMDRLEAMRNRALAQDREKAAAAEAISDQLRALPTDPGVVMAASSPALPEAATPDTDSRPAVLSPVESVPDHLVTGADILPPVPREPEVPKTPLPSPPQESEPVLPPESPVPQVSEITLGPESDPGTATVSLGHRAFPHFEGKYKSVKLTLAQMRVLQQLFESDHRLYPGRILRIALNLWLGLPNQIPEDKELEPLARLLLAGMRNNPPETRS
jgi:hypothetical protein